MTLLTTAHAARALNVHRSRVTALIRTGRLPATKHGRDWQIREADLERVRVRVNGRPRKHSAKLCSR